MAYVCIKILNVTDLTQQVNSSLLLWPSGVFPAKQSWYCSVRSCPWAALLVSAWRFYNDGGIDERSITIVIPAIYLLGSKIQYLGRLLGTAGVPSRHYPILLSIFLNAGIAMFIMKILTM